MSGKQKKNSLLGKIMGKGKEGDEGAAKKAKKKGKLEKQPSLRESMHSERAPTMRTGTHASEGAPLHYEEEQYGAPVTAIHDDDPYERYEHGMREPSHINVRPGSNLHHGGGGYFDDQFSESPRGTVHSPASMHEVSNAHVETEHPNVISLGEQGGMHMERTEHVAVAGGSRQATILAPGGSSEAPRMLKPGDQMEIDPRNPPTFVIDEGITLEIGDEETGFIPYEQYLANLAKQPPPKTGGTYIVQGGGDVVIQDEHGVVIKTIPGTGANAGRGPPQIHEPRHVIPIMVPASRGKTKPRKAKDEKRSSRRPRFFSSLFSRTAERPLSTMEVEDLDHWKEPEPSNAFAFPSLLNLVVDPTTRLGRKPGLDGSRDSHDRTTSVIVRASVYSPTLGTEEVVKEVATEAAPENIVPQEGSNDTLITVKQHSSSEVDAEAATSGEPPHQDLHRSEEPSSTFVEDMGIPPIPTRPPPSPPAQIGPPSPQESSVSTNPKLPASPASDAPLASPNSFEEFDALEDADSDLVLVGTRAEPMKPVNLGSPSTELIIIPFQPILRCETPTPTDELSDLSEVILSPTLSKTRNSQRLSQASTTSTERDRAISIQSVSDTASKSSSRTLTHSGQRDVTPPRTPTNIYTRQSSTPPPRPVKSVSRPAVPRSNTTIPSLPTPPATAILRPTHRTTTSIPMSMSPPPYQEKATQPRLNPSPKIRALMSPFEATGSNPPEDYGNVFVGSTRSLPFSSSASFASRRESVSSVLGSSKAEFGSMWESYSSRPSTPEPSDYLNEFGMLSSAEHLDADRGRRGSEDNSGKQWELRHVESLQRSNSLPTSRPHLVPAIPGLDISLELVKGLRERRLRRAE